MVPPGRFEVGRKLLNGRALEEEAMRDARSTADAGAISRAEEFEILDFTASWAEQYQLRAWGSSPRVAGCKGSVAHQHSSNTEQ